MSPVHSEGDTAPKMSLPQEHREGDTAPKMSLPQEHREGDTAPKMSLPQEHREGDTAPKMNLPQEHREGDTASKMSLPQEHREGDTAPKMSLPQEHREGDTASKMSLPQEHREGDTAPKMSLPQEHREGDTAPKMSLPQEHREGDTAPKMSLPQEHREGDTAPKMSLPQEHREGDTAPKMSLPQEHREGDTARKMSLPQEHREGDTAPKMSLPQEHREGDTASQMSVCLDGERRSSTGKRCSSEGYIEGTDSKRRNIAFQSNEILRPASPTPSSVSLKSDASKHKPPDLSEETSTSHRRSGSSVLSCVSMKSDASKHKPPDFKPDPCRGDTSDEILRPASPTPSCVSLKSDASKHKPPDLSEETSTSHRRKRTGHVLTENLLQCDMCKEKLKDLVSVPSGHRYCRQCICMWDLSELVQVQQAEFSPVNPDHSYTGPGDVACDFCTGMKLRAVKSCLTCPASLCENHVRQHYTIPALQRHTLVEVTGDLEQRLCQQHHRVLEVFCKTDQTLICKVCAVEEHQGHSKLYREIFSVPEPKNLLKMTLGNIKPEHFQTFKRELSEDYPDSLGNHLRDLDVSGVTEKMLDCFGVEGAQRITLHFLNVALPLRKLQEIKKKNLRQKFQRVTEGILLKGEEIFLNEIYTELYITEGGSGEVNNEHEVRQIEMTSKRQTSQETPIKCNDIFRTLPGQSKQIRTVLTRGIAGIGKTVSVQKFILDWADGKANQDITVIVPLPFRDLNLKKENYSLIQLLHHYAPELNDINDIEDEKLKFLFIFDGLDECRFPLDIQNNEFCCNVTKSTSVDVLLTNLIKGNLLPSALLWITSRPAAANQIPPECVHKVTEIRGFNDPQKEEYFRKRISDHSVANRIITHIKSSRSLYIMCHIPVFCWLSATVLEYKMSDAGISEIPKTLTEMYTHFLLIQISLKNQKYHGATVENPKKLSQSDKEMILKLGKLAFQQLEKGNLIFYEEDLRECGIDVSKASEYSSMCTEIFREELGLYREKVFCFVHLSIQEHLAAVYAHVTFVNENRNVFNKHDQTNDAHTSTQNPFHTTVYTYRQRHSDKDLPHDALNLSPQTSHHLPVNKICPTESPVQFLTKSMEDGVDSVFSYPVPPVSYNKSSFGKHVSVPQLLDLHKTAVDKALQSKNGHLDLFLRFLLGLSLDCNHILLQDLITGNSLTVTKTKTICTVQYIKVKIKEESSPERTINLFHCLNELNDNSLVEEIQSAFRSGTLSDKDLKPDQCSALAYMLLMSKEVLDEFDLTMYKTSVAGQHRLLPVLRTCKRARLTGCDLSSQSCGIVASALKSVNSPLRELDLSYSKLRDSGVKLLCAGLVNLNCKLQRLRVSACRLTEFGCLDLGSVLSIPHSNLRELQLRDNELQDSGVKQLSAGLENPDCKLETLGLAHCNLSSESCETVASALKSVNSPLRELDLSYNNLTDSGVKLLCVGLMNPCCKLQKLGLSLCKLTDACSGDLASVLRSPHSKLRELDLRDNDLQDSGVKLLSAGLGDPHCKLHTLGLSGCLITEEGCASLASALRSNPSHLRELDLSYNHPGDTGVKLLSALLEESQCKLEKLKLDHGAQCRIRAGLRKYACQLTLDENTAHRNLSLSEGNRRVTWTPVEHLYPDHPDRFKKFSQVLCREALTERCYWEVEWSGERVFIGITHKSIHRDEICIGMNNVSVSLLCMRDGIFFWCNGEAGLDLSPSHPSSRIRVYLDWAGGTLSFYSIFMDTLTLLYTFNTTFSEPVYAGFMVNPDSMVTLCELEWNEGLDL